jgi:ATP-dependent Lon protease
MDHYLEVEYDLSDVMFVTTANTLNIPGPLMDRMEVIRIAGYTEDEKREIAKRHLLPKAIKEHALRPEEFSVTDDALMVVIQQYTREAGVRSFERELMKLARKAVTEIWAFRGSATARPSARIRSVSSRVLPGRKSAVSCSPSKA